MMKLKNEWSLLDINFGMPLRDSEANVQVCEAISKYELFSKQNIEKHVFNSRLLTMDFMEFISSKLSQQDSLQLSTEVLPHPSRTLIFDSKRLLFGFE